MSNTNRVLDDYTKAVCFPDVSGFEVLELLHLRSKLAAHEGELASAQKARLEDADSVFLRHAPLFYESIAAVGDPGELRRQADPPCSHWWWYLEKLARHEPVKS